MQTPVPLSDAQVIRVAAETCAPAADPRSAPRPRSLRLRLPVFRCLYFPSLASLYFGEIAKIARKKRKNIKKY